MKVQGKKEYGISRKEVIWSVQRVGCEVASAGAIRKLTNIGVLCCTLSPHDCKKSSKGSEREYGRMMSAL